MIELTHEPIEVAALITDADGANAIFLGTVRDHHDGRGVERLEYEAYEEMALRELEKIADEARSRWPINGLRIAHRLGPLAIGDIAVLVSVSTPHRAEAFDACRWIMDTIKETVPIFKKEFFTEGGDRWVGMPEDGND